MLRKILIATTLLTSTQAFAQTLLLPDLVVTKSNLYDWRIDRTTKPGRVLLRFSNGVANIGKGRLEIRGGSVSNGRQSAYQRIFYSDGSYYSRFAGYNVYHPTHGHTHFSGFANYHLHEIEGTTGVGSLVAASNKVSFCLIDESVYNSSLPGFRNFPRYNSCGNTFQGISVGWKDVYGKELPDQWIDITGVESGEYWLESMVDPMNKLRESNNTNNTTKLKIELNLLLDDRI